MDVVFLGARLPLTKTFVQNGTVINASPYPQVSRVTSFHERARSLQEFYDLLVKHAKADHCLFNGTLQRPLIDESRAGMTADTNRNWVVFDFDKVPARDAAEVVAKYLPPECHNVSYVSQLSASMFRPDISTWSGHIFMLLKEQVTEQRLKQWFEFLNFSLPQLTTAISLSDSLQALHWPLDRTVAYNSKLIYIAPPKCFGFEPAVEQHIELVKKRNTHLTIPAFNPIDSHTIRQKINELRRAIGETEIGYDIVQFNGEEMLRSTEACQIHGIKTSGDHYIRFNLNGGDSYAYFIDLRNPEVIRNFKGEPLLKTEDAAPDLYKALRKSAPRAVAKPPLDEGSEVLAFYATNQGAAIKTGVYSPIDRRLRLDDSTPTAASAWLGEYGLVQKAPLPHMDLVFDPRNDVQYVPGKTEINLYRATDYMTRAKKNASSKPAVLSEVAEKAPLLHKIMYSMLGNPDDKVYAHFVNWLAYVFQRREKTGTAWVLHGRTGTGKGSFVKYILTPLFGPENVRTIQFGLLATSFNAFLETALFVVCEEADMGAVDNRAELQAKLRHYITDSPIEINQKGRKTFQAENFSNFIFNANERTAVHVTGDDRRYNIPNRQEVQLFFTPNEIQQLAGGVELDAFADVLQRWPLDVQAVTKVVETEARRDMHEASTAINQLIAEAVIKGDLQFFIDRMPTESEALADFHNRFNPMLLLKAHMDLYIEHANNGTPMVLSDEHLFVLFRSLIPDTRFFQDSKTWRKRHYKALGLDVDKQHRMPTDYTKRVRGVIVDWQKPEDMPETKPVAKHDGNVIDMPSKKRGTRK
jgi:hypothetical protein